MTWCAICTADIIGPVTTRPLGRNNADVAICAACDAEHPRSGRYAFEGSESPRDRVGNLSLIHNNRRQDGSGGGA